MVWYIEVWWGHAPGPGPEGPQVRSLKKNAVKGVSRIPTKSSSPDCAFRAGRETPLFDFLIWKWVIHTHDLSVTSLQTWQRNELVCILYMTIRELLQRSKVIEILPGESKVRQSDSKVHRLLVGATFSSLDANQHARCRRTVRKLGDNKEISSKRSILCPNESASGGSVSSNRLIRLVD